MKTVPLNILFTNSFCAIHGGLDGKIICGWTYYGKHPNIFGLKQVTGVVKP